MLVGWVSRDTSRSPWARVRLAIGPLGSAPIQLPPPPPDNFTSPAEELGQEGQYGSLEQPC